MEAAACRELGAPELLRFDDMPRFTYAMEFTRLGCVSAALG